MDVHVHGNPHLNYRLNSYQRTNDDGLQFLSVEEKECILFFEETIDSLDEGLDDTSGLTSRKLSPVDGLRTSSNSALRPVPTANISRNLMENDIIDLVQSPTNFTVQDFQNLSVTQKSHYEPIPETDPSSTTSPDAHEENSYHPPPGSVPTPVIIASKIGEHQGAGMITPSTLLSRRRSLETKRDPSVPARTPRLPSKINITRSNRDPSPHSLATAAVNIQERRSQMLANLPAGSHPLEGGEPSCVRNLPMRSVSFRDMTPDKSRLEALSKLGLMGGKTDNSTTSTVPKERNSTISPNSSPYSYSSSHSNHYNAGHSALTSHSGHYSAGNSAPSPQGSPYNAGNSASPNHSSPYNVGSGTTPTHISPYSSVNSASSPISSAYKVSSSDNSASNSATRVSISTQPHMSNNMKASSNIPDTITDQKKYSNTYVSQSSSSYEPKPKSEVSSNNFNHYGGKSTVITPSTIQERRPNVPPVSAEVKQTDFNSYGGKSIILNPTMSVKAESISSSSANTPEPADTQYNSYGGRSRVINPVVNSDVPECMNSPHSHSSTNSVTPTTYHGEPTRSRYPSGQNSYDAKPKALTPLPPDPAYQPKVRTKSAPLPPRTAPRPPPGSQRPRPDSVPAEILSKPAPSFRAQGVTVQFSGKGTTGEARRDALRRLGLLNKTA